MNERGLWELFYKTGLPEVWLAVTGERKERSRQQEGPVQTAFQPRIEQV